MEYLCDYLKKVPIRQRGEFRGEDTALGETRQSTKDYLMCVYPGRSHRTCLLKDIPNGHCRYKDKGGPFLLKHYNNLLLQIFTFINFCMGGKDAEKIRLTAERIIFAITNLQEPDLSDLKTIRNFCSTHVGEEPFETIDDAIFEYLVREKLPI